MFNNNPDYYPTPINLQRKMLSKVEWKTVKSCLEPSAGKGDLVEAIKKQFDYTKNYRHTNYKYDIDTIEIDNNLKHILKGKNFRVVHDDFLTFHSYKKYDVIIANFPFSNGDKHLLKALEIQQKGGQIVALINAESIRNPYSNTRKELLQLLEKYNAEVEFLENAFVDAERSTNVTVALINIIIPKIDHNSVIIQELKKEESYSKNEHNNSNLIESDFIKGIVSQFNYEVKAGLKLIDEYNSIKPLMLRSFNGNAPVLKLELEYKDDSSTLENAYIKQIRAKYWGALFSNDQFMSLFTSNLKQKYMELVNELQDYDFSFYNIYSLRIQLSKEMVQGVEDTILNLFEEFSYKHHYYDEQSKNILHFNGWKTNKCYKINARVIIPLNGFYDLQYSWGRYEPTNYKVLDKLKDIEKVFNYLDQGITEEVDLKEVLKFAESYQETKKIETKYFYVTFYKKGTCHLEFKYLDLLHKFNLYAAKSKMWLPPTYGKETYSNMTREEKEVIDQFEGKESYNNVMNNQSYYLVKTEELLKLTS